MGLDFDKIYPIGSIYISANSTNPHDLFGGTWEQLKDRFLLASGDTYTAGATGGEATVKLSNLHLPRHSHGYRVGTEGGTDDGLIRGITTIEPSLTNDSVIEQSGSGYPHNNMPPYLAVYMWKRSA